MITGLELEKTANLNTGLGQFCLNLTDNILKLAPQDMQFQAYLPAGQTGLFGSRLQVLPQKSWHRWKFPQKIRPDVWHCMHQDSVYHPEGKIPVLLTIHDLNFMQKYSGFRRELRKKKLGRMLEKSSALVCISRATGQHLEEVFGLSAADYQVIYNGNALKHFAPGRPASIGEGVPFLLNLGVLSPRKNAHVLCGMLAHLPGMHLVIAGPVHRDYHLRILAEARRYGVSGRIVLAGEVSEEEKFQLLSHTKGLVFPSLAEGFGLPVTEAMSLGKPVFLSRFGSLPEIGGDAAFYWENFDPESMAALVSEGLGKSSSDSFRDGLTRRAALFSWEQAASEYLDIYRRLAKISV